MTFATERYNSHLHAKLPNKSTPNYGTKSRQITEFMVL